MKFNLNKVVVLFLALTLVVFCSGMAIGSSGDLADETLYAQSADQSDTDDTMASDDSQTEEEIIPPEESELTEDGEIADDEEVQEEQGTNSE